MIQYSERLGDMLVSESEWLKQEKPDVTRNEVFCSLYVLHNPQQSHMLSPLCVREAKCLGLESKPTHGLSEWGNTEQREMNEPLPSSMLLQQFCRFQGITLCSLCSALNWNPCSCKNIILVLGEKNHNPTVKRGNMSARFLHKNVVVRTLTLQKRFFPAFSLAQQNPTHTFHHS